MKKIVIAGGTGFIGMSLAEHLKKNGFYPIVMGRHKPKSNPEIEFISWDAQNLGAWTNSLEGALALVNLTGKSVDCPKTPDNCDLILRSRVDSTLLLGKALKTLMSPPKIWIQMSTAHIYGDPPGTVCTEDSSTGYGLAPFVGKAWEEAFAHSLPENTRGVILRTSFVIGKSGGALPKLKKIVQLGLGGKVGSGSQGLSWIHEYDMNEIILHSILRENYSGIYIASAPNPVSNAQFMKALRKTLKVPIGLPAPAFLTRLGATLFFKSDPEIVLYGRYVKSERLEKEGFKFKYPELTNALKDLFNSGMK